MAKVIDGSVPGGREFKNHAAVVFNAFRPSDISLEVAMDGTAQTLDIPAGSNLLWVYNAGATSELIRLEFGTDATDAGNKLNIGSGVATTGMRIPPEGDNPYLCLQVIGIPANAGSVAVCNAALGDTNTVQLIVGA